jgi:hypothetical protein
VTVVLIHVTLYMANMLALTDSHKIRAGATGFRVVFRINLNLTYAIVSDKHLDCPPVNVHF